MTQEIEEIMEPKIEYNDDGSKIYALILDAKVAQIVNKRFPVHESLQWVETDGNTKVGDKYENQQFISGVTIEQKQSQLKTEFQSFLDNTDWYIVRKNDPSSGEEIPQNISDKRAFARDNISNINSLTIEECDDLLSSFNNL